MPRRARRVTLRSAFATDPSITPNPVPAQARGEADRARDDRLDEAAYLRDGADPARATRAWRQLSDAGYLSHGIVPTRDLRAERATNG